MKERTTARTRTEIESMDKLGFIPPSAVDMEQAVLGGIMLERNAINDVINILNEQSFYDDKHALIWRAITTLHKKKDPIDILTVTEKLRDNGDLDDIGGAYAISQLTNRVSSAANIAYHAAIVKDKALARYAITAFQESIKELTNPNVEIDNVVEKAQKACLEIYTAMYGNTGPQDYLTVLMKTVKLAEEQYAKSKEGVLAGIPTSIERFNIWTGGWQKGDLVIIAARPGTGKTAWILNQAETAARHNKKVAFFSLEMRSVQVGSRSIGNISRINTRKFRTGKFNVDDFEKISKAVKEMEDWPIYLDDTPKVSLEYIGNTCRMLKQKYGIDMVIVDYIQLMDYDARLDRRIGVSGNSEGLKALAKELDVPVIAISQISREVEKLSNKRPLLSHLSESGSLENDADMVGLLFRPALYTRYDDRDPEFQSLSKKEYKQVCELIFPKYRGDKTGMLYMRYEPQYNSFTDFLEIRNESWNNFVEEMEEDGQMIKEDLNSFPIQVMNNYDIDDNQAPF